MSNYSIGISGLSAAQKALDIIGNNIANAATEGYHRQRINLSPAYWSQEGSVFLGGGVDVKSVTRIVDELLEKEILRQQASLEQTSQEVVTLRTIENAFGELSAENTGLNAAIDKFFNSLQDLSAHPGEAIWQNQAVNDAKTMASQFRALGEFLTTLQTQIRLEAESAIESVNTLTSQIAQLNNDIRRLEIGGGSTNTLRDQRDHCIAELSELMGVQIQSRDYGVVDVNVAGIPLVMETSAIELEVSLDENADLAIAIVGTSNYTTNIQGGKIGGLLSLKNQLVSDVHDDLDSLANTIIQRINQYHVQSVGSQGSFTTLTGWTATSEDLSDFATVSAGYMYLRVTNASTGTITRTAVPVLQDTSSDTLTEIAQYITSNVTGVTASVGSLNRLTILADANYTFDFLPAVLPEPTASTLTGTPPPTISVSGIYTGTQNDTFEFTVSGAGSVGNGTLQLEVKDNGGAGSVVVTLNIGSGYAAGDLLDVGNGIKVAVSTGDFGAGDNFDVAAFADTDTSGLLAAVGINTFFSGSSAADIAVCADISDNPRRIATSLGADMTDNANALRMAGIRDETVSSLGSLSCGEFYRQLVADVGQQISLKQMRRDNLEVMVQDLAGQQSEISGVDINEEAAQLLVFEQMFQAMAKYVSTLQATMDSLMQLV